MATFGLIDASSPDWPAALALVRHDVFHLPTYVHMEAERLGGTARAFIYRDGPQALVIPLIVRAIPGTDRLDATSPSGYPGPTATSLDPLLWHRGLTAFRHHLREQGVVSALLRLHPLFPGVSDLLSDSAEVVCHGAAVSVRLHLDEQFIAAAMRGSHLRDIKRARRRGYTVAIDDWTYADAFLEIYAETMQRVGASASYDLAAEYIAKARCSLNGAVHLVTGILDGEPTSAALIFEHQGIVTYHLGGTRTKALGDRPSKLILDTCWRWAKARGHEHFLLGGGLHGSSEDSLFHYKAGFSPHSDPYCTARFVIDSAAYAQLCQAGGPPDPSASPADFFPAYRRPPLRDH